MLYEYGNLCCNNINTITPQEQVIPSNKKRYQEDSSSNTEIKKTRTLTENSIMSETIPKETDDVFQITSLHNDYLSSSNNDPQNQKFISHYQINYYNKNSFVLKYQGSLSNEDFLKRTKKLRAYPLHVILTLFSNEHDNNNIVITRQRSFSFIAVTVSELREKGNKLYKKELYNDALDCYIKAYGIIKWIELKDKSLLSYVDRIGQRKAIIDEDILEQTSYLNTPIDDEDDSTCANEMLCRLLLCISYCFMQLRHYKNAIECLDECLKYDEDDCNALFRRSQARMYNKNSKLKDLEIALADIERALQLIKETPPLYTEHYNELKRYIKQMQCDEIAKIKELINEAYIVFNKSKKHRWESYESNGDGYYNIQELQESVLDIMKKKYKMEIKLYKETQNENELFKAYEEFEYFLDRYKMFKFYHKMNIDKAIEMYNSIVINKTIEDDYLHCDRIDMYSFYNCLNNYKDKKADAVFQDSNFNIDMIKTAIDKVNQDVKTKEFLEKRMFLFNEKEMIRVTNTFEFFCENLYNTVPIVFMLLTLLFMFVIFFLFLDTT